MKDKTGGPAFPFEINIKEAWNLTADDLNEIVGDCKGVTKLDYFAGNADVPWNAVLDTLDKKGVSKPTIEQVVEMRAQIKYLEAKMMLKERERWA